MGAWGITWKQNLNMLSHLRMIVPLHNPTIVTTTIVFTLGRTGGGVSAPKMKSERYTRYKKSGSEEVFSQHLIQYTCSDDPHWAWWQSVLSVAPKKWEIIAQTICPFRRSRYQLVSWLLDYSHSVNIGVWPQIRKSLPAHGTGAEHHWSSLWSDFVVVLG